MKNKLGGDFVAREQFAGDLPVNLNHQRTRKTNSQRESTTPKIIVCPPVEDISTPRGSRLLRALQQRLSRRTADADSLDSSSSNDSVCCDSSRAACSCSNSDSGSDPGSEHHRRHRSTVSLSRVFQSLNLSSRSQSCSPVERQRQPKKQQQPKRILRPPVTYTYVRGLSGLPTQRVPRHIVYSTGLNR